MADRRLPIVNWLSPDDIAQTLGVSRMTVYRLIHGRSLRAYRIGRSLRVDPDDFIKYMKSSRTAL